MSLMLQSSSPEQTEQIAACLAKHLKLGMKIALDGDLGAGKTCFMRGLAGYFGAGKEVSSPTYAIAQSYSSKPSIHHLDLYRVQNQDLEDLGVESLVEDEEAIVCIEWSENRPELREKLDLKIKLHGQDETRQIQFEFSEKLSPDWALTVRDDLLSSFSNAG